MTTSKPRIKIAPATVLTIVKLPYPPSLNRYYRVWRGRMVVGPEGKAYREAVQQILGPSFQDVEPYKVPLRVWIDVMMPDRRKRDLDNLNKSLLDAITDAGVWADDSLIEDLRLIKVGVEKPGYVRLTVSELSPIPIKSKKVTRKSK